MICLCLAYLGISAYNLCIWTHLGVSVYIYHIWRIRCTWTYLDVSVYILVAKKTRASRHWHPICSSRVAAHALLFVKSRSYIHTTNLNNEMRSMPVFALIILLVLLVLPEAYDYQWGVKFTREGTQPRSVATVRPYGRESHQNRHKQNKRRQLPNHCTIPLQGQLSVVKIMGGKLAGTVWVQLQVIVHCINRGALRLCSMHYDIDNNSRDKRVRHRR